MMLAANEPLTVAAIEHALIARRVPYRSPGGRTLRRGVADLLAHQVRSGRAVRVSRGTYAVLPDRFSESTRRRFARAWRELGSP
jgi:hypothetical protein